MNKFAQVLVVCDIDIAKKDLSKKVKEMFDRPFGDHQMAGFFLTDGKSCEFITKWTPDWWLASDWIEQSEWDIPVPTTEQEVKDFTDKILG
jgi:hypothetical protein